MGTRGKGPSVAETPLQSAALAAVGEALVPHAASPGGWARPHRLGTLALFAGVFTGPSSYYFYRAADRWARRTRASAAGRVAACVALDQLLFAPLCLAAFTAYAHLVLEGRRLASLPDAIRTRLAAALPRLWPAWVPLSALGFLAVPPQHRPLANNLAGLAVAAALRRRKTTREGAGGGGLGLGEGGEEGGRPPNAVHVPLDPSQLADDPWLKHVTPTSSPR